MLETARREITASREAFERRRRTVGWRRASMCALDRALVELEELGLRGAKWAPNPCRGRVAALLAQVFGLEETPAVPRLVSELIDVVYAAQDAVREGHRRTR